MKNFLMTAGLRRFKRAGYLLFLFCSAWGFALGPIDSVSTFSESFRFNRLLCDACGCSASGGSMGFSTVGENSFLGVRSMYQRYESNDRLYTNSPWRLEQFRTYQIWTRFRISTKLELTAQVPWQHHNRETATGVQTRTGLGDVSINALYKLFSSENEAKTKSHRFHGGLGIKLPTGEFDQANSNTVNPAFQLGTGSFDFTILGEYVFEYQKNGINIMTSYLIKMENERRYRFGNQTNLTAVAYRKVTVSHWQMLPQVGVAAEFFESNYSRGSRVEDTSGQVAFVRAGFDVSRKWINAGFSAMLPVAQDLNNGKVRAHERLSVHLNIIL
ncbi:transporter [Flavobacterium aurantiibacter]|uniref:Transporter n=1 Tax=Flavobacterium aurantiibacter TaxID=2023067 RepID=A0A256A9R6_9FLAO|nr:transporter [Flavobacterium aurantiibacter]OYQ50391.1 hypothetical protein CHX27_00905 [Flavobacterium aurantiibacter]